MLHRSTIQLLRFHFSLFLLPVYLFAISQLPAVDSGRAALIFCILHLLVYPSSNGYNSYMDRDTTPIGGLEMPLQPTRQLFLASVVFDAIAVALSLLVSLPFLLGIIIYISASRAYSYRGIRLKRYPVAGFLTVFIFQGALIFFCTWHGAHPEKSLAVPLQPMIISSLLIGALYPLTQVYQHEADAADGVRTISMLLGKRGSFVFSMALFLSATALMWSWMKTRGTMNHFFLFLLVMLPVVLFFLYWMRKVWISAEEADFRQSLVMNLLSTACTTLFFIILIILKP